MSQPPYPYGAPQEPSYPPPADPYQPSGYPQPYSDPGGYPNQAAYPPTQPYPNQPYSPDPNQGYQPYSAPPQQYSGGPSYPPAQPPGPPPGPQYLNYPGYPQQPTPPKSGGTAAIIAVVAVLLVLVVGGGIAAAVVLSNHGKKTAANSTPTTGTSGGSSTAASPTGGPTHPGDLRTFLVAKPSGAKDCSNQEGTNENLSLDQAAQLSSNPSARKQTLQQYDYTKGAVRCWVSADKTTVDLRLYQFDSADNAHGFFSDNVSATSDGYDSGNISEVTGVPGAKSFGIPKDDDGYASVISIGLKGDVVLVVALAQQPGKYDVTVSNSLLKQLYDKL